MGVFDGRVEYEKVCRWIQPGFARFVCLKTATAEPISPLVKEVASYKRILCNINVLNPGQV